MSFLFKKYIQDTFNIQIKLFPNFNSGDTITVYYTIKEGDKIRIQSFKGVVIKRNGSSINTQTFTVRKLSGEIGVERIFVLSQPSIKKIEIEKRGKVSKSKIYYFRKLKGKKARIKEKRFSKDRSAKSSRVLIND